MSGSGALRRLTVLHLRGAVGRFALDFEAGKTLTIIYGENGTGKSTICDAFDLLGSGGVGSLSDRGLGRTNDYWASYGKSSGEIAVTIEATDGTCHAAVRRNDVVATGAARPRVMVLRRAQILSVVQATDADRYKAIQRFIDVSAVEACEASLLAAVKAINTTLDAAASRIDEQRESIRHYWTTAGSPGSDAMAWAKREVARDAGAAAAEIAALENVRGHYERLREASLQTDAATLASIDASAALVIARAAYEAAVTAATANAPDLVILLEAAKQHLAHDPAPAACPLCDSPDRARGLAARVDERLSAFATLRDARITLDAKQVAADRAVERLTTALGEAARRAEEFERARASSAWPTAVPLPTSPLPLEAARWTAWLAAHDHLPAEWRKASAARESANTFLESLRRAWQTYSSNLADQTELGALLPRMRRAHEIVQEERKRFTDSVLAGIAAEVGRMYEAVHPGEGLDRISLALDPKRRASLTIGSSFLGAGSVPPAAYLSESHLDTLGLCVFLALAGREAPAETILVLDDPLGSVDAPHADRAIEMLYDEVARFRHCVITTHFKPWREKYRWGQLKAGDCQFVELTKWTPASGLTLVGGDAGARAAAAAARGPAAGRPVDLRESRRGARGGARFSDDEVSLHGAAQRRGALHARRAAHGGQWQAPEGVDGGDAVCARRWLEGLHLARARASPRRAVRDREAAEHPRLPLQRPVVRPARQRWPGVRAAGAGADGAADRRRELAQARQVRNPLGDARRDAPPAPTQEAVLRS